MVFGGLCNILWSSLSSGCSYVWCPSRIVTFFGPLRFRKYHFCYSFYSLARAIYFMVYAGVCVNDFKNKIDDRTTNLYLMY